MCFIDRPHWPINNQLHLLPLQRQPSLAFSTKGALLSAARLLSSKGSVRPPFCCVVALFRFAISVHQFNHLRLHHRGAARRAAVTSCSTHQNCASQELILPTPSDQSYIALLPSLGAETCLPSRQGIASVLSFELSSRKYFERTAVAGSSSAEEMTTKTETTSEITLKGSTEIVTEFFGYSINRWFERN